MAHALQDIGTTAAGVALAEAGLRSLDSAIKAIGESAIGFNSTLEQANVAFSTMFRQTAEVKSGLVDANEASQAFLAQLQRFALLTPFQFPDLVKSAQELKAFGIATEDLLPLLKDIGNVASLGIVPMEEAIKRASLAIGELNEQTVVHTRQLNMLTQLGVPAWDILAEATGKTTGEVHKLVQQNQIASDTFLQAFHTYTENNLGDLMEQQSKTFAGAMSNIKDALQQTTAVAFKPFFDLLRDGANQLSAFTQGDDFIKWTQVIREGSQAAVDAFKAILDGLSPIGQAVQDAFRMLTDTGDVNAAFSRLAEGFGQTLSNLGSMIRDLATQVFGGGVQVISSFADGLLSGAGQVLDSAVTTIASTIASFLIGHSPPEQGPLREIQTGGQRLLETYGLGMQAGMGPVERAVAGVADQFGKLEAVGKLDATKAGATEAVAGMDALRQAAQDVDTNLRSLEQQSASLGQQIRDLGRDATDVRDAYTAQLQPLQEQIAAIEHTRDTTRDLALLDNQRQEAVARLQELQAQGDPVLRAQLQTQLEQVRTSERDLQLQDERITNQERLARAEDEAAAKRLAQQQQFAEEQSRLTERITRLQNPDTGLTREITGVQTQLTDLGGTGDTTKGQLEALRYTDQRKTLEQEIAKLQQEPLKAIQDEAKLKQQIADLDRQQTGAKGQLEALKYTQQIADLQKTINDPKTTADQRQAAQERLQQIQLEKQAAAEALQQQRQRLQEQLQAAQKAQQQEEQQRQQQVKAAQDRLKQLALEQQARDQETVHQKATLDARLKELQLRQQEDERHRTAELATAQQEQDALTLRQKAAQQQADQDAAHAQRQTDILKVRTQEQDIQQQINALGDRQAEAVAKQQLAVLEAQDKELGLAEKVDEVQRKLLEFPLKQQMDDLQAAERAALEPIETQRKELERQRDIVNDQKTAWQEVGKAIQDQVREAQAFQRALADGEAQAKAAAAALAAAAKEAALQRQRPETLGLGGDTLDKLVDNWKDKLKTRSGELSAALTTGMADWLQQHAGALIGAAFGTVLGTVLGAAVLGPLGATAGAVLGGAFGGAIGAAVDEKLRTMNLSTLDVLKQKLQDLGDFARKLDEAFTDQGTYRALRELWKELTDTGKDLMDILQGLGGAFSGVGTTLQQTDKDAGVIAVSLKLLIETAKLILIPFTSTIAVIKLLGDTFNLVGTAADAVFPAIVALALTLGKAFDALGSGVQAVLTAVGGAFDTLGTQAHTIFTQVGAAADLLGTAVHTAFTAMGDTIRSVWTAIQTATATAWQTISRDLGQVFETLGTLVNTAWTGYKTAVGTTWSAIGTLTHDAWDAITRTLGDTFDRIGTNAHQAMDTLSRTIGDAFRELGTTAREKWDAIATTIGDAFDQIGTAAHTKWDALATWLDDKWHGLQTTAGDAFDHLGTTIHDTWETVRTQASTAWDHITSALSDAWDGVKTRLQDALDGYATAIRTKWDDIKTTAGERWDAIKDFLGGKWDALQAALGEQLTSWATAISDKWDAVKTTAGDKWAAIKDALGEHWDAIRTRLGETLTAWATAIQAKWDEIKTSAAERWDAITAAIGTAITNAQSNLTDRWTAITTAIGGVWDTAKATATTKWTEVTTAIWTAITGGVDRVRQAGQGLAQAMQDGLQAKFNDLKKLGADALQTISQGMADYAHTFTDWLGTFIDNLIPKPIRDALHIASPSGIMYDIGHNIMQGLQAGLQDHAGPILSFVQNLAGSIGGVFQPPPGSIGGGPPHSGTVTDWLQQAMQIAGVPSSWLSGLLQLVQVESSGNPREQNPVHVIRDGVDYGQATGLLQTLPGTFQSYEIPGHGDIWNPVDNAIAAIRYIRATYGDISQIPLFQVGPGHYEGYAEGGLITEPVVGVGLSSGRNYSFAERGPERVLSNADTRALDARSPTVQKTYQITIPISTLSPDEIAPHIERSLYRVMRRLEP